MCFVNVIADFVLAKTDTVKAALPPEVAPQSGACIPCKVESLQAYHDYGLDAEAPLR